MKVHPACAELPPLEEEKFNALKASIKTHGQKVPGLAYKDQILDGKHRHDACKELNIRFRYDEFKGTEEQAIRLAWSLNADRRQMTFNQLAAHGAAIARMLEDDSRERMKAGTLPAIAGRVGESADIAADIVGGEISKGTIERAVTVLKKGTPEVIEAMKKSNISISTAAELAKQTPKQQRAAVLCRKCRIGKPVENCEACKELRGEQSAKKVRQYKKGQPKYAARERKEKPAKCPTCGQSWGFQRPTVEEVAAYCKERKNTINPEAFIDHYEANGWKIGGKSAMKDWKAAVRNWEHHAKTFSRNGKLKTDLYAGLKEFMNA